MVRCFSVGSVLIMAALAASMVVLPLMLPPLPPPPLVLLFFPVGIMAALMLLAFSPSDGNGVVYVTQSRSGSVPHFGVSPMLRGFLLDFFFLGYGVNMKKLKGEFHCKSRKEKKNQKGKIHCIAAYTEISFLFGLLIN